MSFNETCQSCEEPATIILQYENSIKERYCDKCFNDSRAGFIFKD